MKIDINYEYFLRIIVHKEKNISRALNGFLSLYKTKNEKKFLGKVDECIHELKDCTEKLDKLSRDSVFDIDKLKGLYKDLSIRDEIVTIFLDDLHEFKNLKSYLDPFLELFEISVIALKHQKELSLSKENGKIKVVLA